ncbi:SDR family NAD(P)-dependent oxidoreductase [Actinomadura livida]|uniref:NAD(P)-dependent dehydrogenase (Short-subunit alcohol dehydrogenase family) n=1 Tax=Actinomadura livida TaxID=79909 RepID=A0A7W7IIN6_9ACTN|nr:MULTISPECIES: SDR family oxidoreductase [Actinomadura]MBB4777705.1 NAD(P)-dependent dehydrogenase (short-subunit alcohol dehydrogenase family) [Actinomadura catellatispora]GGT99278.1 3-oxoacyl-ACP reductase [Actinomadura livida]
MRERVALVTGAASGIGAAMVRELAGRGWTTAGLDLAPAEDAHHSVGVDVADPAQVSASIRRIERELGPIEAALCAAGHYALVPVSDIDWGEWRRMLRVHLGGVVNVCKAVAPGMVVRGEGSIVAVTSDLAIGGGHAEAHYAAAKGAVIGLVRSLAVELAPAGVRVNGLAPGPTDTPLLSANSPWRRPSYVQTLPAGRLTAPEEVALAAAFLVEDATFCTGEILSPNAGAVI